MADSRSRRKRHNVHLQALDLFCEVVRQGSFSKGAAECGVTQSAASQLVASLESELGFLLIDRRSRPLRPTQEGQIYHDGCREILKAYRSLLDRVRASRATRGGRVRAVSIYSVGLQAVKPLVDQFHAEHPHADVRLEFCHPSKVYDAVLADDADVGVISYPRHDRSLDVLDWMEEEMVLACAADHRWRRRRKISLAELEGEPFVAFDRDLKIRREVDRALRAHGVEVKIVSEFDNIENVKSALQVSHAVSILPLPSFANEVQRGTHRAIRLEEEMPRRPVAIVFRRGKGMTPSAREFVDWLVAHRP